MKRFSLAFIGLWLALVAGHVALRPDAPSFVSKADASMMLMGSGKPAAGGGGGGGCSQATTFLARVTSPTGADVTDYTNFICGMVTDGLIDGDLSTTGCGTYFDAIWLIAAKDRTTANLNICSTSFTLVENPTPGSSPAFVADRGYTGVDASSTVYLDTQFNPSTGTPKFTLANNHIMARVNTNVTSGASGGAAMGLITASTFPFNSRIFPKYSDGSAYLDASANPTGGIAANANSIGMYVATRLAGTFTGYKDATSMGMSATTQATVIPNGTFLLLANRIVSSGATPFGSALQISAASAGYGLNSTQVTAFDARLDTYLAARGL